MYNHWHRASQECSPRSNSRPSLVPSNGGPHNPRHDGSLPGASCHPGTHSCSCRTHLTAHWIETTSHGSLRATTFRTDNHPCGTHSLHQAIVAGTLQRPPPAKPSRTTWPGTTPSSYPAHQRNRGCHSQPCSAQWLPHATSSSLGPPPYNTCPNAMHCLPLPCTYYQHHLYPKSGSVPRNGAQRAYPRSTLYHSYVCQQRHHRNSRSHGHSCTVDATGPTRPHPRPAPSRNPDHNLG